MHIACRTVLYLLGLILYMVYLVYLNAMAGYIPLAVEIALLLILLTLKLSYSEEKPWHKLRRRKGKPPAAAADPAGPQKQGDVLGVAVVADGSHHRRHLSSVLPQSYRHSHLHSPGEPHGPSSNGSMHDPDSGSMLRSPDMQISAPAVALTTQGSGKLMNGQQQPAAALSLFMPSRAGSGGVASAEQPVFGVSRLGRVGSGAIRRAGSGASPIRGSERQGSLGGGHYQMTAAAHPAGPDGVGNV
jgi:hypothetical protein